MSQTIESAEERRRIDDPILEIEDVNVTFGMNRGQARVLNDVSLQVQRGETLGIVGESGCGKSVFASALMDAVTDPGQLSGSITYHPENGESINLLELGKRDLNRVRWEEIAMVFQGAMNSFNPSKPIHTHFTETLAAHNADKEAGMERAREIMETLNLDAERILHSYQHELSGGQRQRVLIALSLLLEPEVLIMDEPTAALDLLMQRKILKLLYEIMREYDITIVFITHDLPIASGFVDRLAVMYAFEFVELGSVHEVIHDPAHPYTRALLRSTPDLDISIDQVQTVTGSSPDPINIPSGCPYHPRCPVADDRCEIEKPNLVSMESDHQAACFFTDRAREEIPVSVSGVSEDE